MGKLLALTAEERAEIVACLQAVVDEHGDTVSELIKDDSTDAEEFRGALADENHRQIVRQRIIDMVREVK